MGLDSTIIMKTKHRISDEELPYWLPREELYEEEVNDGYEYEISYFRKAYYIHDVMCEISDNKVNNSQYEIDFRMLRRYTNELVAILENPENFDDRSQVFSAYELSGSIAKQILICSWAAKYGSDHRSDTTFVMIDSY